jgi:hypothetical protein
MHFAAKIIREKALVYDLRFPEEQHQPFFILEIAATNHKEFKRVLKRITSANLQQYGTILFSGYGEPPDDLKAELSAKYGMTY